MAWSPRLCVRVIFGVALLANAAAAIPAAAETLLLEFRSPTCGPCRAMQPVVDRLAAEGYLVKEIDVTREPDTARRFRVDSWPTFIVLIDGREEARLVGATGREELVGMINKATANALARTGGSRQGAGAPVALASHSPQSGMQDTFAAEASAGPRVVEIEQPKVRRSPTIRNDGNVAQANLQTTAPAELISATVRLSIEDAEGTSTGAGEIVDSRQGAALILTCGHIFRESKGKGAVEVTMFAPGPSGAEPVGKLPGKVLHYDLDRDLALVTIRPTSHVAVAPIAPAGSALAPGAPVTAIGCNHGENPTAWATQITAVNRYQGQPNVEAAGAPVEGRSGGGLFNAEGQLVGVCFAAEPKENEGLYASLPSIHAMLDELGLAMVYQSPAGGGPKPAASTSLAARGSQPIGAPRAIRGQNPVDPPAFTQSWPANPSAAPAGPLAGSPPAGENPIPVDSFAAAPAATPTTPVEQITPTPMAPLSATDRATLEELQRRGVDAEIICIIRPKTSDGRSEVIKLNSGSPALVAALKSASAGSEPLITR